MLKKNALEYLEEEKVKGLVAKHSGFASSFPIYLFTSRVEEQPIPQDELEAAAEDTPTEKTETPKTDDEEAVVEEVTEEKTVENAEVKMKNVTVEEWVHLNDQPPLWSR
jgi:heat shock protein 90kDa beta